MIAAVHAKTEGNADSRDLEGERESDRQYGVGSNRMDFAKQCLRSNIRHPHHLHRFFHTILQCDTPRTSLSRVGAERRIKERTIRTRKGSTKLLTSERRVTAIRKSCASPVFAQAISRQWRWDHSFTGKIMRFIPFGIGWASFCCSPANTF